MMFVWRCIGGCHEVEDDLNTALLRARESSLISDTLDL
jgi:hypothetical protein